MATARDRKSAGLESCIYIALLFEKMQKICIDVYITENKNVSTIFTAIFKTNVATVNFSSANYWRSCLLAVYCHNARKRISQLAVYCHNARDGLICMSYSLSNFSCFLVFKIELWPKLPSPIFLYYMQHKMRLFLKESDQTSRTLRYTEKWNERNESHLVTCWVIYVNQAIFEGIRHHASRQYTY